LAEGPRTNTNEVGENTTFPNTRYLTNSNQELKSKIKTKSSFGEDASSEPETIMSSSANYIKENLAIGAHESANIKKQLKTIKRNFEIFLSEKYLKNKKSKIRINRNSNYNNNFAYAKCETEHLTMSNSENFSEFSENNYRNFFVLKKFLGEVINMNPTVKNLSENIFIELENNYVDIFSKFLELNEKLNIADLYQESKIL
jgi:hypothetical protein